ncbi:YdcF family protein [Pseudomonas aeruginosa]|nr:YdcF family protein [Pseudomonas aeruginosa]
MPIRYFFKQLLLPPGGLLLLLFFAFWWRGGGRPRPGRGGGGGGVFGGGGGPPPPPGRPRLCGVCGFFGLWLMSMPLSVEWMGRWLESEPALLVEDLPGLAQRADAIVILGAGRQPNDPAWGDDAPSLLAAERLRYAARLAKTSALPVLISGGLHYGRPPSEAALMANALLQDFGVPTRWQEGLSRTTWENATLSAPQLREAGVRRVVLVTQAWHMQRARWSFERQGFEVIPAPVGFLGGANLRPFGGWLPEAQAFWQSGMLLNEAIGLVGYRLFYR